MEIFKLDNIYDYRKTKITNIVQNYFHPINSVAKNEMQSLFAMLTQSQPTSPYVIKIYGRNIICNRVWKKIAYFTFEEICKQPLASADFVAITDHFDIIFVENIPQMQPEDRNEARRFVIFIDCMYERKKILICSAEADPYNLYCQGKGSFEFERTISRLIEMQSKDYLEQEI